MASSMMGKLNEVETVSGKLQEMYEVFILDHTGFFNAGLVSSVIGLFVQILSGRFECEKSKFEANNASQTNGYRLVKSACCKVTAEVMCQRSVFESWMEILHVVDDTSLWLDLFLLEDISKIILADAKDLQPVLSFCFSFFQ